MKNFTIVFILSLVLLFCSNLIVEANIKPRKSIRKDYDCKEVGKPKVKPYYYNKKTLKSKSKYFDVYKSINNLKNKV